MADSDVLEREIVADEERDEADRYVLQKVKRVDDAYRALRVAEGIPLVEPRRTSLVMMERKNLEVALSNLVGSASQLVDVLASRGIVAGVDL